MSEGQFDIFKYDLPEPKKQEIATFIKSIRKINVKTTTVLTENASTLIKWIVYFKQYPKEGYISEIYSVYDNFSNKNRAVLVINLVNHDKVKKEKQDSVTSSIDKDRIYKELRWYGVAVETLNKLTESTMRAMHTDFFPKVVTEEGDPVKLEASADRLSWYVSASTLRNASIESIKHARRVFEVGKGSIAYGLTRTEAISSIMLDLSGPNTSRSLSKLTDTQVLAIYKLINQ